MQNYVKYEIGNPTIDNMGYVVAIANLKDKHDRSAPSNYHWKILKCRMIIFSNSSVLACPDRSEEKKVHIIFNKIGKDYDQLNSLFLKFSLIQDGAIKKVPLEMYQMCFHYSLTARIAPTWNTLGYNYYINNRNFLTTKGAQDGIKYNISVTDHSTIIELKPVKINLLQSNENYHPGEYVRVLPSLNKAVIDDYYDSLPRSGDFKSYKDLRRHWKNIHGYRLPEVEDPHYYAVRFWRGDPFTYPKCCLVQNFPIITTIPKSAEELVIARFLNCLRNKISSFLGIQLTVSRIRNENNLILQVSLKAQEYGGYIIDLGGSFWATYGDQIEYCTAVDPFNRIYRRAIRFGNICRFTDGLDSFELRRCELCAYRIVCIMENVLKHG